MAENIFKLYQGGLWHNEPENVRYRHVSTALERYAKKDYDYLDLVWHIKNAVVGDVLFSETVFNEFINGRLWRNPSPKCKSIISRICNKQTRKADGTFDELLLEIHKWTGPKSSGASLIFEHVIPAKVYLKELIDAYSNHFSLIDFQSIRASVKVCIVTKKEDQDLNRLGLSERMPDGWHWGDDPFARYIKAGIVIH